MVFFRQLLVLRLYGIKVADRLHPQGFPGLPFLRAEMAEPRIAIACLVEIEHPHGIVEDLFDRLAGGEFPAGTLPCGGTPDLRFQRGALKPFVIVPGLVVGAHMLKAEPDIVAQRVA